MNDNAERTTVRIIVIVALVASACFAIWIWKYT
jgi:hypothetical protein